MSMFLSSDRDVNHAGISQTKTSDYNIYDFFFLIHEAVHGNGCMVKVIQNRSDKLWRTVYGCRQLKHTKSEC